MKKTIWTTDHRTLEHYREMSSMPSLLILCVLTGRAAPGGPSKCCFPGVDTLSCKGFTI